MLKSKAQLSFYDVYTLLYYFTFHFNMCTFFLSFVSTNICLYFHRLRDTLRIDEQNILSFVRIATIST